MTKLRAMIKSCCLALLFCCSGLFSLAQSIGVYYNSTGAGRNVTATVSKTIAGSEIGAGIGYNINSLSHPDDKGHAYYKRLHATSFGHYLNFEAFYHQAILKHLKTVEPFFFLDVQFKHSTSRTRVFNSVYIGPSGPNPVPPGYDQIFVETTIIRGPLTWLENTVGLGFRVNVTDKIFIQEKMGAGAMFLVENNPRYISPRTVWEFCGLIQAGLGFRFGQPLK